MTPRNKSFWVPDPDAVPLNASFYRPSPLQKSASLKRRNKALLYNQELGVISKGPDMADRYVTSAEWEARAVEKAERNARAAKTEPDVDEELRQLFGDRVGKHGEAIFDNAAEVEVKIASGEVEVVGEQAESAPAAQEEAAPAADAAVEPEQSKP